MKIIVIRRDPRFSPNSEEKDSAILEAVAERMHSYGNVTYMDEKTFHTSLKKEKASHTPPSSSPQEKADRVSDLYVSMARLPETLILLKEKEAEGARVINSPQGVMNCTRSRLDAIMREHNIPIPPVEGTHGYWVKRGDGTTQSDQDVVFAGDKTELKSVKNAFAERGIAQIVVSAHVRGDLVKFYGVRDTGFFHCCYPTEDGDTKFNNERHNGKAHFYPFSQERLQAIAEQLAQLVGVQIYGGDCIVTPDGDFKIIDFNDWPSFSRCRENAADAIVTLLKKYV